MTWRRNWRSLSDGWATQRGHYPEHEKRRAGSGPGYSVGPADSFTTRLLLKSAT